MSTPLRSSRLLFVLLAFAFLATFAPAQDGYAVTDSGGSWDSSSSTREDPETRWSNVSSYRLEAIPNKGDYWIATPQSGALTPGTSRHPVFSDEMDWTTVVMNG